MWVHTMVEDQRAKVHIEMVGHDSKGFVMSNDNITKCWW